MNEQTAVVMREPPADAMSIIAMAVERGVDATQIEKLVELQERMERNRAAEAFSRAVALFQSKCPRIHKGRKTGSDSAMSFTYAGYDDVMKVAGPILSECGLAVTFDTEAQQGGIKATCRVRHGIHSEQTSLVVPIAQVKVSDTQKFGASLSYAKRYALCAALNIVVTNEDDEAELLSVTESQREAIAGTIKQIEAAKPGAFKLESFLRWLAVKSIAEIPASDFDKVMVELSRKLKEAKK